MIEILKCTGIGFLFMAAILGSLSLLALVFVIYLPEKYPHFWDQTPRSVKTTIRLLWISFIVISMLIVCYNAGTTFCSR